MIFLHTAFGDGITFFVKNQTSVTEFLKVFVKLLKVPGLNKLL